MLSEQVNWYEAENWKIMLAVMALTPLLIIIGVLSENPTTKAILTYRFLPIALILYGGGSLSIIDSIRKSQKELTQGKVYGLQAWSLALLILAVGTGLTALVTPAKTATLFLLSEAIAIPLCLGAVYSSLKLR